jgi:hypothetical protein
MPIRFRCGYCNHLLAIARRKAGTETICPSCGYTVTVPEDPDDNQNELVDLDEFLNSESAEAPPNANSPPGRTDTSQSVAHQRAHSPPPAPHLQPSSPVTAAQHAARQALAANAADRPSSAPAPNSPFSAERLLFDRQQDEKPKPSPTPGKNAASLDSDQSYIVLSAHKATVLAIAAVILLALSFAAGFLLASAK